MTEHSFPLPRHFGQEDPLGDGKKDIRSGRAHPALSPSPVSFLSQIMAMGMGMGGWQDSGFLSLRIHPSGCFKLNRQISKYLTGGLEHGRSEEPGRGKEKAWVGSAGTCPRPSPLPYHHYLPSLPSPSPHLPLTTFCHLFAPFWRQWMQLLAGWRAGGWGGGGRGQDRTTTSAAFCFPLSLGETLPSLPPLLLPFSIKRTSLPPSSLRTGNRHTTFGPSWWRHATPLPTPPPFCIAFLYTHYFIQREATLPLAACPTPIHSKNPIKKTGKMAWQTVKTMKHVTFLCFLVSFRPSLRDIGLLHFPGILFQEGLCFGRTFPGALWQWRGGGGGRGRKNPFPATLHTQFSQTELGGAGLAGLLCLSFL